MLKRFQGKIETKQVDITKLSAHNALRVHAQVIKFISGSVNEIVKGIGKDDVAQAEYLGSAVSKAFSDNGSVEELISFITSNLTDGNVIVDGQRVTHLDDLERFDDVDGSELMYAIFGEWVKLNLGGMLKKIGNQFAG